LPQILSDGGGAGEIEENMMSFALNYEPWIDEGWRKGWLERMERREYV
jgi:hypothetical protein